MNSLRNELSCTTANAKNSIVKPALGEEEAGTGVSFRNRTISGTGSSKEYVRTFPEEIAHIFGKDTVDWVRKRFAKKPEVKNIIKDFPGAVKPGEMLLVLVRPGTCD
ncbi:ATP-binding cassette transporter snq2 [Rhizina undulata]